MQSKFIHLSDAEKLTGKSRATLARLCQKVSGNGTSRKDEDGAWLVDEAFLVEYYELSAKHSAKHSAKGSAKGGAKVSPSVEWMMRRVEYLEEQLRAMTIAHHQILNENNELRRQLEAPNEAHREAQRGGNRIYVLVVVSLVLFAVVLLYFALN